MTANKKTPTLTVHEIAVFSMIGALMYALKAVMEFLPNIHPLGVFTVSLTLVYRKKALYPIYTYVLLNGLLAGFSVWWVPYLYIWTVLWGAVMLLPRNLPARWKPIILMGLCALHGFLFGTLYAPAQALFFGLSFRQTIAWIIAGLPWDAIHGVSNFFLGTLILPLASAMRFADRHVARTSERLTSSAGKSV